MVAAASISTSHIQLPIACDLRSRSLDTCVERQTAFILEAARCSICKTETPHVYHLTQPEDKSRALFVSLKE